MRTLGFKHFGEWLSVLKDRRDATQEELGAVLGGSASLISRMERGVRLPTRAEASALLHHLSDDLEEINYGLGLLEYAPEGGKIAEGAAVYRAGIPTTDADGGDMASASQELARMAALRREGARTDENVIRINAAYRFARFTLRAVGGGYDLEIHPPMDDLDRTGLEDRLVFVRTIEEQHGLKLLPDEI